MNLETMFEFSTLNNPYKKMEAYNTQSVVTFRNTILKWFNTIIVIMTFHKNIKLQLSRLHGLLEALYLVV